MNVQIRQVHSHFVGEVSGVDLSRPLDPATVAALRDGIDRYAVLVFHAQHLTDSQQIAFVAHFGVPERYALSYRNNVKLRLGKPEMVDVSNLDAETGKPSTGATRHRMVNLGNRLWHTDSSFRLPAGGYSMLYAHAVPPKSPLGNGETEFADCRWAYDTLPDAVRGPLEAAEAEHCLMHSRAMMGFSDFTAEERAALPPVRQPLVRVNPRTGRKALYVASHASHIIGMEVPEGRLKLADLIEHITRRENVYRHEWQVGDLVWWDNRATLHRGMPFDEAFARDLRRVTTQDETGQDETNARQAAAE
jgi:alpha-ketoglutarate-dependent 2,4-dichlorophenoxyacetate dioxygenase